MNSRTFKDPATPPVTAKQMESVNRDPLELYWSVDFQQWRICGDLSLRHPFESTADILEGLGLDVNPKA